MTTDKQPTAPGPVKAENANWIAGLDAAWAAEDRPMLFVTPQRIARVRARVADASDAERGEPWYRAWEKTRESAEASLDWTSEPYLGPERRFWPAAGEAGNRARDLAMTHAVTGEPRYADKARDILLAWADSPDPDPMPGRNGGFWPMWSGLVVARSVVSFCYAYSLVFDSMTPDERERVAAFFRRMNGTIRKSQQMWIENNYYHAQDYQNHLAAFIMGMAAIGFVLRDRGLVVYALEHPDNPRDFKDMIRGAIIMSRDDLWVNDRTLTDGAPEPHPGEIYDRYRVTGGSGFGYAIGCYEHLLVLAEAAWNNGVDFYSYTAPSGANLLMPGEFYADFYLTGDLSIKGGYYRDDKPDSIPRVCPAYYELLNRRYPGRPKIREVLDTLERPAYGGERFGYTATLTHGDGG